MDKYTREYTDARISLLKRRYGAEYRKAIKELDEKAKSYFEKRKPEIDRMLQKLENNEITKDYYLHWFQTNMGTGIWYEQMATELANDLYTINERCCEIANTNIVRTYNECYTWETYNIEKNLNINTSFVLVKDSTVKQLAKGIPSMKMDKVKDIAWNVKNVNTQVMQSVLQGEDLFQLRNRFKTITNMNMNVAYSRARTAMTCAENMGSLDSFERAKGLGIKVKKQWLANADDRTRPTHVLLDGETKETDEPFSNGLMYPGDSSGSFDEIMNCRCDMLSVIDDDISEVNWDICSERVNDTDMSYEDWKQEARLRRLEEGDDLEWIQADR